MERTINIAELTEDFEVRGIDLIENSWKFFLIDETTSPEAIFQFRCTVRSRLISYVKGACLVLDRKSPEVRSLRSRLHQINDNYYANAARKYLEVVAHWVDEVDAIYSNETGEEDE